MNEVYFLKDLSRLKEASQKIFQNFYPVNSKILVKIHFGEVGNQTALKPQEIKPLLDFKSKKRITLFDTCTAYTGPRSKTLTHKIFAQSKGWGKLAQIKIGQEFKNLKTKNLQVEVAKDLLKAESVLVISHVKGHPLSGFGGAIKNLGMGAVSPQTKKALHSLGQPVFIKKCQGCGLCSQICPLNAISMKNNQAEFKKKSCWGCSLCILKCPYRCLAPKKAFFDDLLAQAAIAVAKSLPKKTFYVNFLINITQKCDCFNNPGKIISQDLGVLFSQNPVVIDQASLDLINEKNKGNLFEKVNFKDPFLQVKYAANYLKSSLKYQLKEI